MGNISVFENQLLNLKKVIHVVIVLLEAVAMFEFTVMHCTVVTCMPSH